MSWEEILDVSKFTKDTSSRKLCDTCHKQRLTPEASSSGLTMCGTCRRRSGKGRNDSTRIPKHFYKK
tara:strand:+ start:271 stop:471 length:201 start_codon:yes stop_codon:yes gene_type:complete